MEQWELANEIKIGTIYTSNTKEGITLQFDSREDQILFWELIKQLNFEQIVGELNPFEDESEGDE